MLVDKNGLATDEVMISNETNGLNTKSTEKDLFAGLHLGLEENTGQDYNRSLQ